jgi:hypothetical protein
MPRKFIYSEPYANKLPGSNQNYNFRTITSYDVDTNNKAIPGSQLTGVYYAPQPRNQTQTFQKGDENGMNVEFGNYVIAASSENGKPYEFFKYSNADKNNGTIPSGRNVGDTVLGQAAQVSLNGRGEFYRGAINSVKVAAQKQAGLSTVLTAQPNVAQRPVPTQPTGGGGDPPPGDPPVPPGGANTVTSREDLDNAKGVDLTSIEIEAKNSATDQENLVYPFDLRTSKQDRIKFTVFEYAGADIKGNSEDIFSPTGAGKIINRTLKNIKGSVTLPIQPSITDSNTVEWSGATLNGFQAAAFGKSLELMESKDIASFMSNLMGSVEKSAKGISAGGGNNSVAQALKVFLAQEAIGIQGLLSRASGAILNPNLELLFSGPQLRPFNFTFRLSPRDAPEATEVRKIIRFFKQNMAVRTAKNNLFLKAPHVFGIQYQFSDTDRLVKSHKSLNRIKKCALLSCDVDYTPDGTYMTFNDPARTLTSYQLSLRFSELEPVLDEDYTSIGSDEIRSDEIGF